MAMKTSNLRSLGEGFGDRAEISGHSRYASTPSGFRDQWSVSSSQEDVLNLTPRQSYSSNSNAEVLVNEIAAIELEIIHLERHILSLYRTTFGQYMANFPTSAQALSSDSNFQAEVSLKGGHCQKECPVKIINFEGLSADNGSGTDETNQIVNCSKIDKATVYTSKCGSNSPMHNLTRSISMVPPGEISEKSLVNAASCHHTLADHLCASVRENIFGTPSKLSEDIVKCISAVYCKLNIKTTQTDYSSSPVSSLLSSSTFSPPDKSDTWSPRYYYEPTSSPSQLEMLKGKNYLSNGMVLITRICIDKDRFKCAAALLESHRLLVRRLESVDPSKLDHEEKLAFWINIHNAMVMHAFIAYGLENNHIRITPSVMKKSYNVGGVNFSAYDIQTSILGCRSHRPEASIRSLLPPVRKLNTVKNKHVYVLDRLEPLVHFALCLGAYSDPAVRVYTAKNVISQLQVAKEEFIQTNFYIHKETKIILPKILEIYAKDASLDLSSIFEIVHDCLPQSQQKALRQCIKEKQRKCIEWSSYKSTFRYILHRDLNSDKQ